MASSTQKNGFVNEFSLHAMTPNLDTGVSFLPALVFNLMDFEVVATMTKKMKDVRDMSKSLFLAAGITGFLYVFGTAGIFLALPLEGIGLVTGIIETLHKLFGGSAVGELMVYAVGIMGEYLVKSAVASKQGNMNGMEYLCK